MSAQPEVPSADLFRHPPLLLFVASHNFSQLAYAVDETVPVAAQSSAWNEAAPGYRSPSPRGIGAIPGPATHALAGRAALALIFALPAQRGAAKT